MTSRFGSEQQRHIIILSYLPSTTLLIYPPSPQLTVSGPSLRGKLTNPGEGETLLRSNSSELLSYVHLLMFNPNNWPVPIRLEGAVEEDLP